MIKRLLHIRELTIPEQRIVIFVLCVLVAFFALRSYRNAAEHPAVNDPAATVDQPFPSPGIRP